MVRRLPGLVFVCALWSCAREAPAPERSELTLAHETPVLSLDPTLSDGVTFSALSNVYEPLVAYDREMRLVPALAATWGTPDETTWELTLREGVRFHDGTPLSAPDVVAALERARSAPESGVRSAFWAVGSIEAAGSRVVRIRTTRPDALLLHQLTQVLLAKGASRDAIERAPVGTGPYRVERWERHGALVLSAAAGVAGPPQSVSRLTFVGVPEGDETLAALATGRVDVAPVPPRALFLRPRPFRVESSEGLTTQILWMRSSGRPGGPSPFADRRVRRAVSLCLDRRALAHEATGHGSTAASQAVPQSVFGHDPTLAPAAPDVAAARRLLAEAGHSRGLDVTLTHRDDPPSGKIAALLREELAEGGIRVALRPVPWEALLSEIESETATFYLMRWQFDSGDAGTFFRDCLRTRGAGSGAANPGFSSPEVDALVDEVAGTFDAPLRLARLQRLGRIVQEEVPFVPLYRQPELWGVAKGMRWVPRVDGLLLGREMAFGPPAPAK